MDSINEVKFYEWNLKKQRNHNLLVYISLNCIHVGLSQREREGERLLLYISISHICQLLYIIWW